jgi:hypothetical protein
VFSIVGMTLRSRPRGPTLVVFDPVVVVVVVDGLGRSRGLAVQKQGVFQPNAQPAGRQFDQLVAMVAAPGIIRQTAQFDGLSEGNDPLPPNRIELGWIGLERPVLARG